MHLLYSGGVIGRDVEADVAKAFHLSAALTRQANTFHAGIFSVCQCVDHIGAYAAVIPLWVKQLMKHEAPVINGDGSYSRDFTYIDNVIQANELAAVVPAEEIIEKVSRRPETVDRIKQREKGLIENNPTSNTQHPTPFSEVFNVAFGGNTTLNELFDALRTNLAGFDSEIAAIEAKHGPNRAGDIPHSMASIDKAKMVLGYDPEYDAAGGFGKACAWYFENLK